jgi:hypothetical protein
VKSTVDYMLHVTGAPKGTRSDQSIVLRHRHTAEVREVGRHETRIAFEALCNIRDLALYIYPLGTTVFKKGTDRFQLREFDGRLYARFDGAADKILEHVDPTWRRNFILNAPVEAESFRTISNRWPGNSGSKRIWPRRTDRWPFYDEPRNPDKAPLLMEDALPLLESFDTEEYANGLAMCEARGDGLLFIDGELWMESPKPCFVISHEFHGPNCILAKGELGLMPYVSDGDMVRRYFPLSRYGEANDFSHRLRSLPPFEGSFVDGENVRFETNGLLATEMTGYEDEHLQRLLRTMAISIKRSFALKPERMDMFAPGELASVEAAYEETLTVNNLLKRSSDLLAYGLDLKNVWTTLKRPLYGRDPRGDFSTDYLDMTLAEIDQRPISIHSLGM